MAERSQGESSQSVNRLYRPVAWDMYDSETLQQVLRHHWQHWMGSPGVTLGIEMQKEQRGTHLMAEDPEQKSLYRMNHLVGEP